MVTTLIDTIVSVVTGLVSGLGEGISDLFTAIFMTGTGETATISNLGIFVLAVLGIGIAMSIFRWTLSLIRNRG